MKYKKGLAKRLIALFLVCVMIISSGSGFSMQASASEVESGADTTATLDTSPPADPASVPTNTTGSAQAPQTQASQPEQTQAPQEQTQATQAPQTESTVTETTAATTAPSDNGTDASGQTNAAGQTNASGQTNSAGQTEGSESTESTKAPESSSESSGGASNTLGTESSAETQESVETETETESEEIALMAMDNTSSSFVIEGSVNKVQNLTASILSGESFDYIIGYTVPPIQGEGSYSAVTIQVELPEHLSVVPDPDGINQLSITGQDVKSVYMRDRTLVINLHQTLQTGEAKTVTIKFQTDNFKWKNGSKITLNPVLTGNKSGGASVTGKLAENAKPVVTVTTDDGWMIDKTVGKVSSDDAYYYVPYTVKVINTKSGADADEDRFGRLDVAGMQVIDVLPLPDTGKTNASGQHIGYAINGAPAEIIDVKMGETALTNGTDYTVSGDNGQIVFKKTAVSAANGKYTKAGTPISTTYTYTVKYPKAAYITPSNESKAEEYWLQNTATLKYTLLGQNEATDKDTAEIVLGEKEKSDEHQDLTVKKVVLIDGTEYGYTTGYGTVKFTLFTDANCTKVANNYNGEIAAGEEQAVSNSGTIAFKDLKPGTYYLKETVIASGLSNTDTVVRVLLASDGTVSLPESEATAEISENQVKVKNTADGFGTVEFYKYGKNSEGTIAPLAGVEFTLTSNGSPSKKYTAVSDADGHVLFVGIPAGSYVLKESSVGVNSEYEVVENQFNVTVVGNKNVYPSGLPNEDNIDAVNGAPVFENISGKGKFKIHKISSNDSTKNLAGAKFHLYGPYDSAQTSIPADAKPVQIGGSDYVMVTGDGGLAVSEPLKAGYYILKEIEAPADYAVIGDGLTSVQIIANTVREDAYVIENDEMLYLDIRKVGTVTTTSGTTEAEELAGAVFEIYKDNSGDVSALVGTIITYLDGTGRSTSCLLGTEDVTGDGSKERLHVGPGTYYWKEKKAPDNYELIDSDLHEIKLENKGVAFTVYNSATYAQIEITKTDRHDAAHVLMGAEFEVYSNAECTSPVNDSQGSIITLVTDKDGKATAMVPVEKDGQTSYWLKEVKAPEGYYPSSDVIKVDVKSGQQTAVTVTNDALKTINVIKRDSEVAATKLPGVEFEIYGPYDASGTSLPEGAVAIDKQTTNSDGVCEFTGLVPGKWYYLKEVQAANGYALNESIIPVQTTDGSDSATVTESTITNDRLGRLEIEKTTNMDCENGQTKPLAGVEFTLYKAVSDPDGEYAEGSDHYSKGDAVGTKSTVMSSDDTKASITFDDLVPGIYILEEKTPEGHKSVNGKVITVQPGYNQGTGYPASSDEERVINNTAEKGKVALDKVSSIDPNVHIKATFDILEAPVPGQSTVKTVGTLTTTGTNTPVVSDWLAPGDYVLVETSVTGDYTMDGKEIPFTIEAGKTTQLTGDKAVVNVPKGKVSVKKVAEFALSGSTSDETATYDLTGSVLKLYKKTGDNTYNSDIVEKYDKPAQTFDLRSSAEMTSELLDAGEYWIVEEEFPEGYKAPTTSQALTVQIDGQAKTVYVVGQCEVKAGVTSTDQGMDTAQVSNITDNGKLRVNKYGFSVDAANLLDGARFEVYKVADKNTEGAIHISGDVYGVKVEVSASTDSEGFIMESGTNGKGSALSIDMEPGIYYVREVDTSKIEGGPWYPYTEWQGPITITAGTETSVDFINYSMHGEGTKTDENSKGLAGATFAAFGSESDAKNFQAYVQSLHITPDTEDASNAKAKLLANLKDESFLSTHKIVAVSSVSDSNGKFSFEGLVPEKTYYICEVVAPDEYALNTEIVTATVNKDGVGFTKPITFSDYKLGRLTVEKFTILNATEFNVAGIAFNVYRAVEDTDGVYVYNGKNYKKLEDTPVASGTSDAKGIYTSILLEEGTYIVEETVPAESPVRKPNGDDTMAQGASNTFGSRDYVVLTVQRNKDTSVIDDQEIRFYNPATYGKFTFKKVDQDGKVITGSTVTFKLYRNVGNSENPSWELVGNTITASQTDQNYVSDFLPAGEYKLVEVSAPGYTIAYGEDNPLSFKIEGGKITGSTEGNTTPNVDASLKQPLVLTNIKQGSLELLKVGMLANEVYDKNLEGAQFILYKNVKNDASLDCVAENIVVTGKIPATGANKGVNKTGNDGKCKWENLDAGSYWLKEIEPAANSEAGKDRDKNPKYTYSSDARLVTIEAGQEVVLDKADANDQNHRVENTTTYGQLKIRKVDANNTNKGLEAIFKVYLDKECTKPAYGIANKESQFTTDKNTGVGTSYPLPAGTNYYLKETKTPDGYTYTDGEVFGPYTIKSNEIIDLSTTPTEYITNTKQFSIKVTKKATNASDNTKNLLYGSEFVAGAVIGLYESNEANAEPVATQTTDANGVVTFTGLKFTQEPKTWYVREITPPDNGNYALNTTFYPVEVSYGDGKQIEFTINAEDAANKGILYDDEKGNVSIIKQVKWQGLDTPAKDVEFALYAVSEQGQVHSEGSTAAATLKTDGQGNAKSKPLDAGWYELVETKVPEGYAKAPSYWIEIKNNEESTTLYNADGDALGNTIVNEADKGKFILYKWDGDKDTNESSLTRLDQAQFTVERKVSDAPEKWEYTVNNDRNQSIITVLDDTNQPGNYRYESGYLEPGTYRITEITTPEYSYNNGGTQQTITFALNGDAQEFEITKGETLNVNAYNSPQGSITLTKYGQYDPDHGDALKTLSGATFKLYKDKDCTQEIENSLRTADGNGVCRWENLDPGTYYIKETADGKTAVNNAGFEISTEVQSVVIERGTLVARIASTDASISDPEKAKIYKDVTVVNQSNAGKIRIVKTNADGSQKLAGAEFKIYAQEGTGWSAEPLQILTITDATTGVVSDFLKAEKAGTTYKIVETHAPEGYTLDGEMVELEQIVTVYPYHEPSLESGADSHNYVTFKNEKDDSMAGLSGGIHKQIREAGDGDNETTFSDDPVTADASLLSSAYTLEFKVDGYADGKNEKPVKELTVTDNRIGLEYIESVNSGSEVYKDLTVTDRDYTINSLTVNPSANTENTAEKPGAEIYIQSSMAEKAAGTWTHLKTFSDVSETQNISFDGRKVVGVKVVYTNTLEKFSSDGLVLNITFANRGEWSTETDHEVRRINNTADITWKDTYLDAAGQEKTRERNNNSNTVLANIPSFTMKIPEIAINTEITDSKTTFYSGDEINFRVLARNMSLAGEDRILRQPVLSLKLPAQTALDESKYQSSQGFLVRKVAADGSSVIIPQSLYTVTATEVPAALKDQGGDSYGEDANYTTTQYAFAFADNDLTTLAEGESIQIEFRGYISYESKGGFDLVIPAYLSSSAKIPKSSENPKGLSFVPYNQTLYENPVTDALVGDDLSYVNDTDSRVVTDTTAVKLLKSIGVKGDDGQIHWLSRGAVATVHPAGEIYYKLTLYNYSDAYIETAKFVDVFPGPDDTYITSMSEGRGTDIPFGPGYEKMTLLDASAGGNITWYSTNHDFSTRRGSETTGILQPLYYMQSDWSNWSGGIMSNATALGAEVDFTNGGTAEGLEPSGSYEIIISMRAPGYTADKISEYYGKFMDNSAAVSVVKAGAASIENATIPVNDRVEPNKVRATMDLPTGSIGDYVWFDSNANGIQDSDEAPVEGMTVELWQTRYYTFNGSVRRETKMIQSTVTDQDGKYLFSGLPCQYLAEGSTEGSQNPSDYVGGEYYTYQVKFIRGERYDDYTFTQQEAGSDRAVDSNPDANGETKDIQLKVISNADGSLSGESNMTIDAGILTSYALGDYVWLDRNCNGVQDDGEIGVPDVPVFLYKVDGPNGEVAKNQTATARTVTDKDGRYWFDNLMEGYYVVEFDISNLKKLTDNGYTYRYDFTQVQDTSRGEMATDSDARHAVDTDGRIRRTNVITLTEAALRSAGLEEHADPRWDAGLVTYSAIGGYVFDDQDYDDLQSIYIPLEGTLVELFEVNPDGSLSDQPVATQVVGADGKYFFDHLAFGTEYKDYSVKFTYPDGYIGVDANADGDGGTSDPAKDSHFDSDVNDFATDASGNVDRTSGYIRRIRLGQDMITTTWDAGARKYSAIGDYVWIDENKNGLQDDDETPVPGVTVVLQSRKDSSSPWEYESYTVTDENGRYEFHNLESSDRITKEYRVVFVLSETTKITTLNSGSDSTIDSDAIGTYMPDIVPIVTAGQAFTGGYVTTYIKPGYGEEDMTWDAGIVKVFGAIGDYVWYDDDHNGIQDDNEKGVPNVPVILEMNTSGNSRDEDAWVVVGEMTTDENGRYLFEGLESGYYRVKFQIPVDYVNTRYNRGTGENGNAVDSDASREAGDRWYYTAAFFLPEGTIDLTWDAGIYKPTTRTETTTNREPVDRVVTTTRDRVTRTTRTVTRTRNERRRNVRTGDPTPVNIILGIAIVSLGVIGVIVYRKKKKNDGDKK